MIYFVGPYRCDSDGGFLFFVDYCAIFKTFCTFVLPGEADTYQLTAKIEALVLNFLISKL